MEYVSLNFNESLAFIFEVLCYRILMLATDYSKKRQAFGLPICQYPLHVQTLARMELETRGSLLLILEVARWLGMDDNGVISDQDNLMLRMMTPILKLYTAKQVRFPYRFTYILLL